MNQVKSVWLKACISIPPSLASYMQGTGEGSPGLPLPDLASAPLLLCLTEEWCDGGMVEEGGIEPD